jgi:hypothetical protein
MKLESGMLIGERLLRLMAATLDRLNAKELETYKLLSADTETEARVLMATSRGLADVRLLYADGGRTVDVTCTMQPWHLVSASIVVSVKAGRGDTEEGGQVLIGGEETPIERDPRRGQEFDEFAAALLEHASGKPEGPPSDANDRIGVIRTIDQSPSGTSPSAELYRSLEPSIPNREQRRRK